MRDSSAELLPVQVKYFCNEAFELGLYGKAIDAYQVGWVITRSLPCVTMLSQAWQKGCARDHGQSAGLPWCTVASDISMACVSKAQTLHVSNMPGTHRQSCTSLKHLC